MRCEDGGKAPMLIRDTGSVSPEESGRRRRWFFVGVTWSFFYWEYLFRSGRERKNPKDTLRRKLRRSSLYWPKNTGKNPNWKTHLPTP